MKLQTIIEHDLEITNLKPTVSGTTVSLSGDFKITHSKGIKNNTITLQNLVRTSPEFRTYIENAVLSSFNFASLEPSLTPHSSYGYFGIFPKSAKKGGFYFYMVLCEEVLNNPAHYISSILGGC